jgi:hypothetical protein
MIGVVKSIWSTSLKKCGSYAGILLADDFSQASFFPIIERRQLPVAFTNCE